MNVGTKVKPKTGADILFAWGEVVREHDDKNFVSVMWVLTTGGLLCQKERIDSLIPVKEEPDK